MKVGVNVAIIHNEQVLLTKREDFEVWCLPGGHVDNEESVAQAAIREIAEETGLEIQLTRLVGLYSIPKAQAWANLVILFAGKTIGGTLKAQQGEVAEMRYFHFTVIPENLLWGRRQRVMDAINGNKECVVWLQNVPFDPTTTRQELYDLRDKSGLSGHEFYAEYFGWDDTDEDRQEVG